MTDIDWPRRAGLSGALDEAAIVAITDRAGQILYCNQKFAEVSGYSCEELVGRNHRLVNSGHHPREFFQALYHTIASGAVWRGTIYDPKAGKSYRSVLRRLDANRLEVKGCIGPFCQTQVWRRGG